MTSHRRPGLPAAGVSGVIRRAMTRRNVTFMQLVQAMGVSRSVVDDWLIGRDVPLLENAQRLSEVLSDDGIVNAVRAVRLGRCLYEPCGRPFERRRGGLHRVYCSPYCRTMAHRFPDRRRDSRQDAIDAFCASCEPVDRTCRDATCPLRAFSPFVFVPLRRDVA